MVYRPELSDETRDELEEVKTALKKKNDDGEHAFWRRDNMTFDVDWIIRQALESFRDDVENKWV